MPRISLHEYQAKFRRNAKTPKPGDVCACGHPYDEHWPGKGYCMRFSAEKGNWCSCDGFHPLRKLDDWRS